MPRIRSPNYPQMSLQDALERVGPVFEKERRHSTPKGVLIKHLGYNSMNGSSLGAISALLKYGLLERDGEAYRVSDLAMSILYPESADAKATALRTAAKGPSLFVEILENFGGTLPSDENLRSYLVRQGFADSAIEPVIKNLRETMGFAGMVGDGAMLSDSAQTTAPPKMLRALSDQRVTETIAGTLRNAPTTQYDAAPSPIVGNPYANSYDAPKENTYRVSVNSGGGLEVGAMILDQVGVDRLIAILTANKALLPENTESPKESPRPAAQELSDDPLLR